MLQVDILCNKLSSNRMVKVLVLQEGLLGQFSTILGSVEVTVKRTDKLHTTLLSDKLDDAWVDLFVASHDTELLPTETNISVTDRAHLIELVHLAKQVVGQWFAISQTFQEDNYGMC